jgi:hypothetical protein
MVGSDEWSRQGNLGSADLIFVRAHAHRAYSFLILLLGGVLALLAVDVSASSSAPPALAVGWCSIITN